MTFEELQIEELNHIISDLKQQLNKELNGLYKDLEKANAEINRLKMIIELKDDARVELVEENTRLKNDLQQASNEIKLLNDQIDKLIEENNQLKLRNKMLTKIGLNSIYGIHCCKNHCVYTDTPQLKTGHWIEVTNGRGGHECSLCHEYAPSYQNGDERLTKFCPNCGAKMESEDK